MNKKLVSIKSDQISRTKILLIVLTIVVLCIIPVGIALSQTGVNYQPLAPIKGSAIGDVNAGGGDFGLYVNSLFRLGIVIASILAVLMILWGGIEYMMSESPFGKGEGKQRITAAIGGLILALATIVILNTINPEIALTNLNITIKDASLKGLVNSNIPLSTFNNPTIAQSLGFPSQLVGANGQIYSASELFDEQHLSDLQSIDSQARANPAISGISPTANSILSMAQASVGRSTFFTPNTECGNKACALFVSEVAGIAAGDGSLVTLGTGTLNNSLSSHRLFVPIPGGLRSSLPGDIVVSPDGHTGVVETSGGAQIISNSSSLRSIERNYTAERWENTFGNNGIHVYRAR